MQIIRFCGKEKLPGGERAWRRLASAAGFKGTLKVYGYGAGGSDRGKGSQLAYERGQGDTVIIGLFTEPDIIEIWLPCKCQTAMDEWTFWRDSILPEWLHEKYEPMFVFAHELGHYKQYLEGSFYPFSEKGATKRGKNLLEKVVNGKGSSRIQSGTGEDSVQGGHVQEGSGSNPSQCDTPCQPSSEEGQPELEASQVIGAVPRV